MQVWHTLSVLESNACCSCRELHNLKVEKEEAREKNLGCLVVGLSEDCCSAVMEESFGMGLEVMINRSLEHRKNNWNSDGMESSSRTSERLGYIA